MGYDVTNKNSFQEIVDYWYKNIKELANPDCIFLLGNKIDLHNNIIVNEKEGKIFADTNNIKFFSISVKNNINIDNFINDLKIKIENNMKNNNHINNGINEIFYGNPTKEQYKIILLGDSGVGSKTSFLNRIINNTFDENCLSTSGGGCFLKKINLNNGKVLEIVFWDTPGQKRYRYVAKSHMNDIDCAIMGFDVTLSNSFGNIKTFWYDFVKKNSSVDLIYLVGNKADLYEWRCVEESEARKYCEEKNIRYFEISCLTSEGIEKLLADLTNQLIKK